MKKLIGAATALLLSLLMIFTAAAEETPPLMQVHQISNGITDAYLIRCGETAIMIDGGNDSGIRNDVLMDYLRQSGIDRLDTYIITHYHDDHSMNINAILSEFGDENTQVYGPSQVLRPVYEPMAAGVYHQMKDGDTLTVGSIQFKCVGPAELRSKGLINQDSLNFLMIYGTRRFLFTGDFVHGGNIMSRHKDEIASVDVLKFPHHGLMPFCIDPGVLRHVNPSVILLPGAEPWNTEKYARANGVTGEVYCIGEGHVVVLTDGTSLDVVAHAQPGQFADR